MNRIEKEVFRIVRTGMNEDYERSKVLNINNDLMANGSTKLLDVDKWLSTWGELDMRVVMAYSKIYGVSSAEFARKFVDMDEQEKFDTFNKVKHIL